MPVEAVAHGDCQRGRVMRESLPVETVVPGDCRLGRVMREKVVLLRRSAPREGCF